MSSLGGDEEVQKRTEGRSLDNLDLWRVAGRHKCRKEMGSQR